MSHLLYINQYQRNVLCFTLSTTEQGTVFYEYVLLSNSNEGYMHESDIVLASLQVKQTARILAIYL
jgi:hypothetical protein